MKIILTCFAAFSILTAAYGQKPLQEPTALGTAFFNALLDEDGKTLGMLLSGDMTFTNFDGDTIDADSLVQNVNEGLFTIETGAVSDAQTRQITNDAALITGEWKAKGIVQGNGFNDAVAFSVLCVKQGNGWKIVNVQFTPIRQ